MKALAAEITRKLGKRLKWLGVLVRELTGTLLLQGLLHSASVVTDPYSGDMQLTRAEIAETQVIITTPEKWDVVTRKPTGEGELATVSDSTLRTRHAYLLNPLELTQKVKLLIIDEVHLLNEDRGAVIETIVARTLRQVESTQSLIRVVGLSTRPFLHPTLSKRSLVCCQVLLCRIISMWLRSFGAPRHPLPSSLQPAEWLRNRVSPYQGLFFFDSSFRPVPLEQHFIGVKGKANSPTSRKNLDRVTFKKVSELVAQGHQVMVFVHARKETVKTAEALREAVLVEGFADDFDPSDHPQFEFFRRDIGTSRNKEMKRLFDAGFGIHHAGMLRSDRNMMERMFEARAIKVSSVVAPKSHPLIAVVRSCAVRPRWHGVSIYRLMQVQLAVFLSAVTCTKIYRLPHSRHQRNASIRRWQGLIRRSFGPRRSPNFWSCRTTRYGGQW